MKSLTPTPMLLIYDTLFSRKKLTPQESQRYKQLQKGFIGEKKLEKLYYKGNYKNIMALFSCLYEHNEQEFQIDCTLVTSDTIYLLEVKNYSGNYTIHNNKIYYLKTRQEISNPFSQIERTELLFKSMLKDLKINLQVRSYIVFINKNLVMYNTSEELPIIFAPQIERFFQKVNANAYKPTKYTTKLTEKLLQQQMKTSSYSRYPKYDILECTRGLFCSYCHAKLKRLHRRKFVCTQCDKSVSLEKALMFAVAQFHLLFPDEKMKIKSLLDWCGNEVSDAILRRVLTDKLNVVPKSRYTYYYFESEDDLKRILSKKYIK